MLINGQQNDVDIQQFSKSGPIFLRKIDRGPHNLEKNLQGPRFLNKVLVNSKKISF